MRRRPLIAMTALMLLACGTAQAADWVSLGKSSNGKVEDFIEMSSVRIVEGVRRAWFKMVFEAHWQKGGGPHSSTWAESTIQRDAFNCVDETHRGEALTNYYADGSVEPVSAYRYPEPWAPVPPDTVEASRMTFICALPPK